MKKLVFARLSVENVAVLAFLLLALIYLQGIEGPFLLDDFAAIVENPAVRVETFSLPGLWQAAFSSTAGPLQRPLPMASFALDHFLGGLTPAPFKLTNLLLHLANAMLVFLITRRLAAHWSGSAGERWFPLFVSCLWAFHPLQVSTVLYVVQRMTLMSTLFMLAAVLVYLVERERQVAGDARGGWWRAGTMIPLLFGAAVLSKENGLLLPVYLLAIELTVWRFAFPGQARLHRQLLSALLVLPTLAILAYLLAVGVGMIPFATFRDFTAPERLLTEGRVLGLYLTQLAWPDIARMPFYYDGLEVSRGMLSPPATLLAAGFWGILLLVMAYGVWRQRAPVFCFAVLWFIGGHLLESTTIPLELGFEHRNYLPAYGPILAGAWALRRRVSRAPLRPVVRTGFLLGVVVAMTVQLDARVRAWATPARFFDHALVIAPDSARAWSDFSFYLSLSGQDEAALAPLAKASSLNPREAGYPLTAINLLLEMDRVPDAGVVEEASLRLRRYPLSAYGHNAVKSLLDVLTDRPPAPHLLAVFEVLIAAAAANPALRPDFRPTLELASAYLEKQRAP